ncbi:unnamed protein product [Pedinophyceae sp. YPF-701]|nr:unnamed protein product [Pedinophyceae sp. YPF-701]
MAVERVGAVVIGAGAVGLACARALASRGRDVFILERESKGIGMGTSSRNSEVIHAGLYYQPGSHKARLCVEGRHMLYDYLSSRNIPHKRLGKILAAPQSSSPALDRIFETALRNGVEGLHRLTGEEARSLEPEVSCGSALLSESTGIMDSHAYMQSLLADAEASGAVLALGSVVKGIEPTPDGRLRVHAEDTSTGEELPLDAACVVNAAGLDAQNIARATSGLDRSMIPPLWLAKGNYFTISSGPKPMSMSRLIYPVPSGSGGLGVHLTLDLQGNARFGPDVEWLPEGTAPADVSYEVNPGRAAGFAKAIAEYWPGVLRDGGSQLEPSYAGVRPKVVGPGAERPGDFVIQGPGDHGIKGLINLFGIESPGLTSSLALGEVVANKALR